MDIYERARLAIARADGALATPVAGAGGRGSTALSRRPVRGSPRGTGVAHFNPRKILKAPLSDTDAIPWSSINLTPKKVILELLRELENPAAYECVADYDKSKRKYTATVRAQGRTVTYIVNG